MAVTKESFGTLKDGREAHLFTITNPGGSSVTLMDFGAAVVKAIVPDGMGRLEDVALGASNSWATGSDGTVYIGGYYGPDPVAIDAAGNVLWQTSSMGAQAKWLYALEPREDGLYAHYSMLNGDKSGWVVYNYDGTARGMISGSCRPFIESFTGSPFRLTVSCSRKMW